MDGAQQTDTERQSFSFRQFSPRIGQSIDIVADLFHVSGPLRPVSRFADNDVLQGGLGAFYLGRDDGLLADKAVQEPARAGDQSSGHLQATDGRNGLGMALRQLALNSKSRSLG
jgi:hypothetical protein